MFIPKKDNGGDKGGHKTKGINKDIVKKKRFDEKRQILDKHIFDCIKFGLGWIKQIRIYIFAFAEKIACCFTTLPILLGKSEFCYIAQG